MTDDNIILELKRRFLKLQFNDGIEEMKSLQTDYENYLSSNEDNEYRHIENTIYVLKALIDYNLNDNRQSAYEKALPMFENLSFGEKIELTKNNYNKFLLTQGITLSKSYVQAKIILDTLEKSVEKYPVSKGVRHDVLVTSYVNFIEVLVSSKFCSQTTDRAVEEIKMLFFKVLEKAKKIILEEDRLEILASLTIKEA